MTPEEKMAHFTSLWEAAEDEYYERLDAKAWVLVLAREVKRAYADFDRAIEAMEAARKRADQAKQHLDRVYETFERVAVLSARKLDKPGSIQ